MKFQAGRCAGEWYGYILQSLQTLHSPDDLRHFITVDLGGQDPEPDGVGFESPWIKEETSRLESFSRLLIELASARSWSQMMYTNNSPNCFVGVLHPTLGQQLLNHQKSLWEAILLAERFVHDPSQKIEKHIKRELEKRLEDVCWHELQLAREVFITCASSEWDASNPTVVALAQRIFGVPVNTKFDLEDLFAHLTSVSKMSSLATPMSKHLDFRGIGLAVDIFLSF